MAYTTFDLLMNDSPMWKGIFSEADITEKYKNAMRTNKKHTLYGESVWEITLETLSPAFAIRYKWRKYIFITSKFFKFSPEVQKFIILHERGHLEYNFKHGEIIADVYAFERMSKKELKIVIPEIFLSAQKAFNIQKNLLIEENLFDTNAQKEYAANARRIVFALDYMKHRKRTPFDWNVQS